MGCQVQSCCSRRIPALPEGAVVVPHGGKDYECINIINMSIINIYIFNINSIDINIINIHIIINRGRVEFLTSTACWLPACSRHSLLAHQTAAQCQLRLPQSRKTQYSWLWPRLHPNSGRSTLQHADPTRY